ncbi:unnamed protein product [Ambrosiozyma monospora]|uniref:Enhancer of polycomb-like protein n=1 Tax=Ambrosiozyma monospora TaxID=43982 RepID=A0A9W7DI38_AMBMO|nr:unnamed protein product [Ambrosiozyma monospora]
MDEVDETFLEKFNKSQPKTKKCTEDEFEIVVHRLGSVINEKQPFLSMDPNQILSFQEIKEVALVPDTSDPSDVSRTLERDLKIHPFKTLLDAEPPSGKEPRPLKDLLELFGPAIYEHWRKRRIERGGLSIVPQLKFEEPSQKDDNDPYVCFRRREFRQARKTRRTDAQGTERLNRFYHELRKAKNLLFMVAEREVKRKNQLTEEKNLFNLRCQVKELKRTLGIKGDDEDLITHKKKKVPSESEILKERLKKELEKEKRKKQLEDREKLRLLKQQMAQNANAQNGAPNSVAVQPYVKLPSAKIPDLDLTTVNAVLQDKLEGIKKAVSDKLIKRKLQDEGWVNFTDDPYNPYFSIAGSGDEDMKERSHVPYSSICSSIFEVEDSREIDFSYIFNNNKHYSHNDPDIIKINAQTGQVVRNDKHNCLPVMYDLLGQDEKFEDENPYVPKTNDSSDLGVSETLFKVRKRTGRNGRLWIDRKRIRDDYDFMDFVNSPSSEEIENESANDTTSEPIRKKRRTNVYDRSSDYKKRLRSRFDFDSDLPVYHPLDPSKLNQIGKQTQIIRFGSMLLAKSYDNMHQIRQKQIDAHKMLQQRILQQKQQQMREAQAAAAANSANGNGNAVNGNTNGKAINGSPIPGNSVNGGSVNSRSGSGMNSSSSSSRQGTPNGKAQQARVHKNSVKSANKARS